MFEETAGAALDNNKNNTWGKRKKQLERETSARGERGCLMPCPGYTECLFWRPLPVLIGENRRRRKKWSSFFGGTTFLWMALSVGRPLLQQVHGNRDAVNNNQCGGGCSLAEGDHAGCATCWTLAMEAPACLGTAKTVGGQDKQTGARE